MQYKTISKLGKTTACIVVGMFDNQNFSMGTDALDSKTKAMIKLWTKKEGLTGKAGETLLLRDLPNTAIERVLVVGCGKKADFDGKGVAAAISSALSNTKATTACVAMKTNKTLVQSIVEESEYAAYAYDATLSKKPTPPKIKTIQFFFNDVADRKQATQAIKVAMATISGVNTARNLGDMPANLMTPSDVAKKAQAIVKESKAMKVTVLSEAQMRKLKMYSLLSVSTGSDQDAKLVVMEYKGAKNKSEQPYALVGKGVTFDSGGISLKPGGGMDEMKYDMCGAASVLGVFQALTQLNLPINVVGIIPTTENMPNGRATKPGDVITSMSGQTIEVLNTDAEGRLILCDALTYVGRFKPKQVIDIATLTGACIVALGHHISGMMSNNDSLAKELETAGKQADDKVWRLPLADEDESYDKQLDSNFADMGNIGGKGAGTITAGCFLARFAKDYHWAHLDIAGTAWKSGAAKGATGRPVKLLLQYLMNK